MSENRYNGCNCYETQQNLALSIITIHELQVKLDEKAKRIDELGGFIGRNMQINFKRCIFRDAYDLLNKKGTSE